MDGGMPLRAVSMQHSGNPKSDRLLGAPEGLGGFTQGVGPGEAQVPQQVVLELPQPAALAGALPPVDGRMAPAG